MKTWYLLIAMLALAVLCASFIIACGDDDDDDDSDDGDDDDDDDDSASCTVTDICTLVYDKCPDSDGYDSVQECVDAWFGLCMGTFDEAGYMDCTCDCFDAEDSCNDFFQNCELACWGAFCV